MTATTTVRSLLHSLLLALINLFSILLGFAVFKSSPQSGQLAVQVPIAIAGTVLLFTLWRLFLHIRCGDRLRMHGWKDGGWILALSLIWAPILFVPLHYLTQGYLTSLSNLLALLAFQLAANALAVGVSHAVVGKRAGRSDLRTGSSSAH